jgi:hypothetical protein
MKRLKITEAQYISIFGKNNNPNDDIYYQDGDFVVTNDRMNKRRELFNPWYEDMYKKDKGKILHQLAFAMTMKMVDNNEKLPEFGDYKLYHSTLNKPFSKEQVKYVEENFIAPKYGNMSLEELYDVMSLDMERNSYEFDRNGKKAVANLINDGFFDKYLNGMMKDLALWDLGKLDNVTDFIGWLYSKNPFTKKLNRQVILDNMSKTMDEIADSDESFMGNEIYIAFNELISALSKLNKKG